MRGVAGGGKVRGWGWMGCGGAVCFGVLLNRLSRVRKGTLGAGGG
jgi:hypothetical protein